MDVKRCASHHTHHRISFSPFMSGTSLPRMAVLVKRRTSMQSRGSVLALMVSLMALGLDLTHGLVPPAPVLPAMEVLHPTTPSVSSPVGMLHQPSSWIDGSSTFLTISDLACLEDEESSGTCNQAVSTSHLAASLYQRWKRDTVLRVVDANTVKLEQQGLVTLAGMQMPSPASSNFQFPDCFDKSPSYKIRSLIPKGTTVRVQVIPSASSSSSAVNALIVREDDGLLVNAALVETGFGRLKEKGARQAEAVVPDLVATLASLQQKAQILHAGMYQSCDADRSAATSTTSRSDSARGTVVSTAAFEAQFEPLEPEEAPVVPPNPGDRRNCADFETYEEAYKYYETFFPYYGDVARLDRDGDGVPCPGLPHTENPDLYRMKVPKDRQGTSSR